MMLAVIPDYSYKKSDGSDEDTEVQEIAPEDEEAELRKLLARQKWQ